MRTLKSIKILMSFLSTLALLTACEKEGETLYLSEPESSKLVVMEKDIVLSNDNSKQIVLSLAWTTSTIAVSNPDMGVPDVLSMYVQISTENDFSTNVYESPEKSLSKTFTGSELNAIAKNLNTEPNVTVPFYIRLRASVGPNIESVYSNTETVNVTPYFIDMSKGYILDSKMELTDNFLISPTTNGVYTGFIGAAAWYNFYLLEGDGTTWGNDGVDGSAFLLSSENDPSKRWNCWFPEPGGCHYVTFDTQRKQWSTLFIETMFVTGDIETQMTFDRPALLWKAVFVAQKAGNHTIKLEATAKTFDYSTGDKNDGAKAASVAFTQEGENIIFADQPGNLTVSVPGEGEYTLIIDFSDQYTWKARIESGSEEPEPVIEYLYLPGIDDGINGGTWTFDNYICLWNPDEKAYAGVVNVNSLWGYSFSIEKDNWDDKYTPGNESTPTEGTLVWKGEGNIPAPQAGIYLIQASLKDFSYNLTGPSNEIYVLGLDDSWKFDVPLTATDVAGVYSGPITFEGASPWGFKIHLIKDDWDLFYGGSDGILYFSGNNITDDKVLPPGTYTMKVDLIKGTYIIE